MGIAFQSGLTLGSGCSLTIGNTWEFTASHPGSHWRPIGFKTGDNLDRVLAAAQAVLDGLLCPTLSGGPDLLICVFYRIVERSKPHPVIAMSGDRCLSSTQLSSVCFSKELAFNLWPPSARDDQTVHLPVSMSRWWCAKRCR
jgi:hypothetical protein